MNRMESLMITLVIVLTSISFVTSQSCSSFTYTQHPPTPLTCKPYSNDPSPTWQLRTNCAVQRDTTATTEFEIHWIHRDVNGIEEDLGEPSFNFYNPNVPEAQSNGPRQANTPFTEDMVGQYWCQVFLIDGTPLPVYSNGITVLRPEEYDSQTPVCQSSLLQVVGTNICNDSPPAFTAAVASSTTTSTTTSAAATTATSTSRIPTAPSLPATTTSIGNNEPTVTSSTAGNMPLSTTAPDVTATSSLQPSVTLSSISTIISSPGLSVTRSISTTTQELIESHSTVTTSTQEQTQTVVLKTTVTPPPPVTFSTMRPSLQSTVTNEGIPATMTTSTTNTNNVPDQSVTIVPEGREEMSEMSYLLLTAVALIVILSILIVLLLIIAYMMKCGRHGRNGRRKKQQVAAFSTPRRTSSTELLDMKYDQDTTSAFNTIDYKASSLSPQHVATTTKPPNSFKQHIPHSYSIIDETSTGLDSAAANGTINGRSFNFQLKPPAILRSKSPSLNGSLHTGTTSLSQSLLPSSSNKIYPVNNNTFQYSELIDRSNDNRHSQNDNIELQNEQRKKDHKERRKTEESANRRPPNAHKLRTKPMSNVTELESGWDNQLQDNPMYMKLPVGLRVINTL